MEYRDGMADVARITGRQAAEYDQDLPAGVTRHVPAKHHIS